MSLYVRSGISLCKALVYMSKGFTICYSRQSTSHLEQFEVMRARRKPTAHLLAPKVRGSAYWRWIGAAMPYALQHCARGYLFIPFRHTITAEYFRMHDTISIVEEWPLLIFGTNIPCGSVAAIEVGSLCRVYCKYRDQVLPNGQSGVNQGKRFVDTSIPVFQIERHMAC